MVAASNNQFPSILFGEGTTPTSPGAGTQRLFIDTADHKLKRVNSTGTVTTVEGGAATGVFGFPYTAASLAATEFDLGLGANQAMFFRALEGGTITKIGLSVVGGTQSGHICVGVYANSGTGRSAAPGTQKATSGSVVPVTLYQEVALGASTTVVAGDWLAIAADNTTVKFWATATTAVNNLGLGFGAYQNTAFPLPATAAVNGAINNCIYLVGV